MNDRFRLQDVQYVVKNQGNYQVKDSNREFHFKDFFKMVQDPRFQKNQALTPGILQQAKVAYKTSGDMREIFKVLKKHNIKFHPSFQSLLEGRKRKSRYDQSEYELGQVLLPTTIATTTRKKIEPSPKRVRPTAIKKTIAPATKIAPLNILLSGAGLKKQTPPEMDSYKLLSLLQAAAGKTPAPGRVRKMTPVVKKTPTPKLPVTTKPSPKKKLTPTVKKPLLIQTQLQVQKKIPTVPTVRKISIKKPPTPKPIQQDLSLIQALSTPYMAKIKKRVSFLPSPFLQKTKVNVQYENKQVVNFHLPGDLRDCLTVVFDRKKQTLYVSTILWFKNFEACFQKKIKMKEIVHFLKETANQLGCKKIYLDDQSYIPIPQLKRKMVDDFNNNHSKHHHPPFYKVLLTLSEGQTLYMKEGFFCLPKDFLHDVDKVLEKFPEQKETILRNTLLFNQAFSSLVLACVSTLKINDVLPRLSGLPPSLSMNSTIQDLAIWIKQNFQKKLFEPEHDITQVWAIYDELSKSTFGQPRLYEISSSKKKKMAFYDEYLSLLCPLLSLPPTFNFENTMAFEHLQLSPPFLSQYPEESITILCKLLWSLSSSFCETAMYHRGVPGKWTKFRLPGHGQFSPK